MTIRRPAIAGMFYPDDPHMLATDIDRLLEHADFSFPRQPKALILPHAGYVYSGSTAALAYAALAPWRSLIHRVVLLGPTHRVAIHGLALPEADAFATPLGTIQLDQAAMQAIAALPQITRNDQVHAQEHSLEVHLPFLQRSLDEFTLVPLAVGQASPEMVADVLECLWGKRETLFVISSDLSHFLPYAVANQIDIDTCQRILHGVTDIRPEQACGAFPINGLLLAAHRHQLQSQLIGRCNSGDTAGERGRVVGYAAFALYEADHG